MKYEFGTINKVQRQRGKISYILYRVTFYIYSTMTVTTKLLKMCLSNKLIDHEIFKR